MRRVSVCPAAIGAEILTVGSLLLWLASFRGIELRARVSAGRRTSEAVRRPLIAMLVLVSLAKAPDVDRTVQEGFA
jgi:hypothetical protein